MYTSGTDSDRAYPRKYTDKPFPQQLANIVCLEAERLQVRIQRRFGMVDDQILTDCNIGFLSSRPAERAIQ
jgi:hypothetical protein